MSNLKPDGPATLRGLFGGQPPSAYTPLNPSPIRNALIGNVALNNIAAYFDGPSVAQGSVGTWFASGSVTVLDTAGAATFKIKLWDGATVIDSAIVDTHAANARVSVALSGFLAAPAGNLRLSVEDVTSTSGEILANASGSGKDSTITAFRIA